MFTAIFWLVILGVCFSAVISLAWDMYQWFERSEEAKRNPPPRQIPPDDLIGRVKV